MKLPCEVIADLIPLCKDGVASVESCHLVEEHIKECASCLREYESTESTIYLEASLPDEKQFLRKFRLNIIKLQGILLIFGAILGVSMTFSINMFYNFLLMPVVGVLAFRVFGQRYFIAPTLVFVLSMISNGIRGVFGEELGMVQFRAIFTSWAIYSAIYAFLVLVGWGIGWLLHYAFGRDESKLIT